jgi:hypothetical protein
MPRLRLAVGASRRPGEIIRYRVIETRGGTSHRGASREGELIAERVGEIIARRELKHELGSKSNAATGKPLALTLPARTTTP